MIPILTAVSILVFVVAAVAHCFGFKEGYEHGRETGRKIGYLEGKRDAAQEHIERLNQTINKL